MLVLAAITLRCARARDSAKTCAEATLHNDQHQLDSTRTRDDSGQTRLSARTCGLIATVLRNNCNDSAQKVRHMAPILVAVSADTFSIAEPSPPHVVQVLTYVQVNNVGKSS